MMREPITVIFPGDLATLRHSGLGEIGHSQRLSFTERIRDEMHGRPAITDPVSLHFRAILVPPPEWPLWKAQQAIAGEIEPDGPPDLLTLARIFTMCARGVAFVTDEQITALIAAKKYGPQSVFVASVIPRPHPAAIDHQEHLAAVARAAAS